jgi:3-deoxy-manno-octulosonate cytidylyltransferase (CMP-KDO synthetase)
MKIAIVIPARYASTRFPRKMLANETGKPLIQHVWENTRRVAGIASVLVATDHADIESAVRGFGGDVVMTRADHPSGSDRIAEVAKKHLADYDLIVNVQGDEPSIDPSYVEKLVALYAAHKPFMGTLVCPFENTAQVTDPNCVKAVLGHALPSGQGGDVYPALYFTRALAPYPRDTQGAVTTLTDYHWHLGIYAYSPVAIRQFVQYPVGRLETIEKLEQLRALENGHSILVTTVPQATRGIDTPEQYADFVQRYRGGN